MYSVLNCHNVAKQTEFYLGKLQLIVTFTGNVGCFKKRFTVVFQMLLCGEYYEKNAFKCERFPNTRHTVTFEIRF
jgi:hypothetical protein